MRNADGGCSRTPAEPAASAMPLRVGAGRPDPTPMGVGGRYERRELLESILEPSARIHPDYVATVISTRSGRVLQGILRLRSGEFRRRNHDLGSREESASL